MNYQEAVAQAETGQVLIVGNTAGCDRYANFTRQGDRVDVRLFQTVVVQFYPDHMVLSTGGFRTLSTSQALNALISSGRVYSAAFQWYYQPYDGNPVPFEDGMRVDYSGS